MGDGGGETCAYQRIEASGARAAVLDRSTAVEIELAPGRSIVSLHPSRSPLACASEPVMQFETAVSADAAVLAIVYRPDGATLSVLQLPMNLQ